MERARELRDVVPSGTGAYSNSKGVEGLRKIVAGFIEQRDGYPANPEHVFLTDGASPAVQMMIKALIRDESDGLLIPIPQYPLYSAAIAMQGGAAVGYFLEEGSWGLHLGELRRALDDARASGTNVRALAIINPGNPTGQCLDESSMVDVVRFCEEQNLVLLADEVYQVREAEAGETGGGGRLPADSSADSDRRKTFGTRSADSPPSKRWPAT